jgi:hypothetical protein
MRRSHAGIAAGCLASHRAFSHVLAVLLRIVLAPSDAVAAEVVAAAADALEAVGGSMVGGVYPPRGGGGGGAHDAAAHTATLFAELALPLCIENLKRHPEKRAPILRLALAFGGGGLGRGNRGWGAEAHTTMIRALQERLQDMPTFIPCLALLVEVVSPFLHGRFAIVAPPPILSRLTA